MKNVKISFKIALFSFAFSLLFLAPIATWLSTTMGVAPVVAAVIVLAADFVIAAIVPRKRNPNVFTSAIQREIWADYIIQRLFKDNTFLKNYCYNDDQFVLAGKVVHIPNPGATPVITVNRSTFPATAVRRTDTDLTYTLNEYTTAPTHIENAEYVEASYDKINSIIGDHIGYLANAIGDNALLTWCDESVSVPAVKAFTSGGAAAVGTDSIGTALTGTRNVCVNADIRKMALQFNLQNIPKMDRYAVLEANMYDQLMSDLSVTQYRDFSNLADPANGIVGKLYGFTILERDSTITYNAANALNAYGATSLATDKYASVFWQKDAVTRALGEVKLFENIDRPEYYGNIYSALVRFGGRRRRSDNYGVGVLIAA